VARRWISGRGLQVAHIEGVRLPSASRRQRRKNGGVGGFCLAVDGCMSDGDGDGNGRMEEEGRRVRWCWDALPIVKGEEKKKEIS